MGLGLVSAELSKESERELGLAWVSQQEYYNREFDCYKPSQWSYPPSEF
jgi:hypothetical protein